MEITRHAAAILRVTRVLEPNSASSVWIDQNRDYSSNSAVYIIHTELIELKRNVDNMLNSNY